jgi:hypothetical protein
MSAAGVQAALVKALWGQLMGDRNGDCRETGSGVEIARRYAGSSKISQVVPWQVRVSYLLQAEPCVIVKHADN